MQISLKTLKYSASLSDETNAFTAKLVVDGVVAGDASNHGQGGETEVYLSSARLRIEVDAYLATLPPQTYPPIAGWPELTPSPWTLESLVDKLVEDELTARQHRRWCAKSTVFALKDGKAGEFNVLKAPFTAAARAWAVKKYGENLDYFLNEKMGQTAQ